MRSTSDGGDGPACGYCDVEVGKNAEAARPHLEAVEDGGDENCVGVGADAVNCEAVEAVDF